MIHRTEADRIRGEGDLVLVEIRMKIVVPLREDSVGVSEEEEEEEEGVEEGEGEVMEDLAIEVMDMEEREVMEDMEGRVMEVEVEEEVVEDLHSGVEVEEEEELVEDLHSAVEVEEEVVEDLDSAEEMMGIRTSHSKGREAFLIPIIER